MKPIPRVFFLLALITGIMIILPATAVTITESPEVVHRGEQIFINMQGLQNNSLFSLLIEGQFPINPGQRLKFSTNNFLMPITLKNGEISATTQNTKSGGLSVKKGDTTITLAGPADPKTGIFTMTKQYSVSSGLYDFLLLDIQPQTGATLIETQMNLMGTKTGPADSQISFTVEGIDNGIVRLIIFVDSQQVLYKTVTVGSGLPPQTTVPTTTMATTTATTTTTQTTATTATTTTTQTTATTATQMTTATTYRTELPYTDITTTQTTASGTTATATPALIRTFYSAERKVSLTAYGIDYAGLLMVRLVDVPESWLAVTDAYAIAPDTLSFSPKATITFTIPESTEAADYAYFIGQYTNGKWQIVQSRADTTSISGTIDRAATYALMAYKTESILHPSGTPMSQETTHTGTVTPRGTPNIASIAQETTPTPTATKTPLSPVVVAAGLVVGGAVVMCRAKK